VSAAPVAAPVREALGAATDALRTAGVQTPHLDAELLLAAATGSDPAALRAHEDGVVDPAAGRRFGAMVRRRLAREPVAYILGRKGFRRLELDVDPRVLIPRPETELLVEVAVELNPASVLDVGTGSGAVALAVADELPEARVVATDTSWAALDVARANAERLGLGKRISFQSGTLPAGERFDLVVANLPYVSEGEWRVLAAEIVRYEPREALVAGPTGLEAIERLLDEIAGGPARPGAIALEVGAGQAARVGELMRGTGFGQVEVRQDLAGIERVVVGR
jgi:release factor glutamine methyltransferase